MRTTLTIDDQTAAELRERAHRTGKSFKQIVNETLRSGLQEMDKPRPRPYRLKPATMGKPGAHLNLDKALAIADTLEDEAIAEKAEQYK